MIKCQFLMLQNYSIQFWHPTLLKIIINMIFIFCFNPIHSLSLTAHRQTFSLQVPFKYVLSIYKIGYHQVHTGGVCARTQTTFIETIQNKKNNFCIYNNAITMCPSSCFFSLSLETIRFQHSQSAPDWLSFVVFFFSIIFMWWKWTSGAIVWTDLD